MFLLLSLDFTCTSKSKEPFINLHKTQSDIFPKTLIYKCCRFVLLSTKTFLYANIYKENTINAVAT